MSPGRELPDHGNPTMKQPEQGSCPGSRVASALALALALALPIGCGDDGDDDGNALVTCPANLAEGDLVITEIMANPAGDDAGNEWFEILNATDRSIELDGVLLAVSKADHSGEKTHAMAGTSLAPGEFLVVGEATTSAPDDLLDHIDYAYGDDLGSLTNSAGRIAIVCNGVEVDGVLYRDMENGISQAVSSTVTPGAAINDQLIAWCASQGQLFEETFATPGSASDCISAITDGTCQDGSTRRPLAMPAAGDLVLTEVMPDPSAASDAEGEWFEVYVARDLDLNGVSLGRDPTDDPDIVINAASCLPVAGDTYLVFGKNPVSGENGGLPRFDFDFSFGLTNSGGTLYVAAGASVLDEMTWSGSDSGASTSLDPAFFDPAGNDSLVNWCPSAQSSYGEGDLGTPGAANERCPVVIPEGMCDDNGTVRPIVSPAAGQALITEYMANPNTVSDANGEWIEVRFDADVDLNGLTLGRTPGTVEDTIDAAECLRVSAGTRAIFARKADSALNGGLPPVAGVFGFGLVNTNGSAFVGVADTTLDSIAWSSVTAGGSDSLDEGDNTTFCVNARDPYGPIENNNHGTPGAANPSCPIE